MTHQDVAVVIAELREVSTDPARTEYINNLMIDAASLLESQAKALSEAERKAKHLLIAANEYQDRLAEARRVIDAAEKRFDRIALCIERNLYHQREKVEDAKQIATQGREAARDEGKDMSKSALLELVDRVEKASGPDRELDGELACLLYASPAPDGYSAGFVTNQFGFTHPASDYTSSLDAAMTLADDVDIPDLLEDALDATGDRGWIVGDFRGVLARNFVAACLRAHGDDRCR